MGKIAEVSGIQKVYGHYIGGEWVNGAAGETFDSINPATEEVIASFQAGNAQDIDYAVSAATQAFQVYGNTTIQERAQLLGKIADALEAHAEDFAIMESMDNGKPIRETRFADIPLSVDHFRYFAAIIRGEEDTSCKISSCLQSYNYAEPLGVVGPSLGAPSRPRL